MMDLFARQASIGNKITLTLTKGKSFKGVITGFGEDFTVIKTKKGIAAIHYKMIGAWEILSNSNSCHNSTEPVNSIDHGPENNPFDVEFENEEKEEFNILDNEIESIEKEEVEKEDRDSSLVSQIEILLEDFKTKVASAELVAYKPDMSFPLNGLNSDTRIDDKKQWDKINNQYQNCIKNKNSSLLPTLSSQLLKFAEKYPDIGVFHYNAGCYLANYEDFQKAHSCFEEAFYREPLPKYLYNAAYSALKIQNHEKAHINLAAYFNLIFPMENPDAWYVFCSLTERELASSIFRDLLLSLLENDSRIEEVTKVKKEEYINETLSLLLKSALYVLLKDKKYKAAEPLVAILGEDKSEYKVYDLKDAVSLLNLALKDYSIQTPAEYKKLIDYEKSMGLLEGCMDPVIEGSSTSSIPEEIKPILDDTNIPCEDEHCSEEQLKEDFWIKIPRRHGYVYTYFVSEGYGFIMGQNGENYFFHVSSIIDSSISNTDLNNVNWGAQIHVIFEPSKNSKGEAAVQISAYIILDEMQKMAEQYAKSGDLNKAIEKIEYVLSIDSEHPKSGILLETWKKKLNEIKEEEKALNKLTESESNSIESWCSKTKFLIKHRRYEEALDTLDKVIKLTPESISSLPLKGNLSSFSDLYTPNPDYVKALCKKSLIFYQLGRDKEALKTANSALEMDKNCVDALFLKASCLLLLQRPQEACELIDFALDLEPKKSELLFLKGKTLLKFHKYEEGLEYIEKTYQLTPGKPEILSIKGYALSKLKRYEEALKIYNKAIDLQPDNRKTLSNTGFILIMAGKYDEALKLYNKLIQLNPLDSILWSKKGAILTKLNRSEEALKAVERSLEIASHNFESLFTKGYIFSKAGKYEEALRFFDSVLEVSPYDQKTLAKRALVLSKLGRHDEAFTTIEDALEINLHNSRTWYYKGVTHFNFGEYKEAFSAFKKSAELNPLDTRVGKMKQLTLVKLGRTEEEIGVIDNRSQIEDDLFDGELEEDYELEFED